jgi:ATP-dependent Clp protease ATP-binding subunit ClpA
MFERFTDRARRVVVLAQNEARDLRHDYIGPEHILLGLVDEGGGVAAKALEAVGISAAAVRENVVAAVGQGEAELSAGGHIPFTEQTKQVLELSLRESLQLGCNYIGTEHILLGLLRQPDSTAARVLTDLGAEPNAVRMRVVGLLQGHQERPGRGRPVVMSSPTRAEAVESRVTALERWAGLAPDLTDLDDRLEQLRRDKQAAFDREDFEAAAAIRDAEHQLERERKARVQEWEAGPPLHTVIGQLNGEIMQLRALLRQHGVDPSAPEDDDGAAQHG